MTSLPQIIVCVDDDRDNLDLLERMLRTFLDPARYTLVCVASGTQALHVLAAQPVRLLITDYLMPGVTGLDLLDCVKQHTLATQVMLVTGYTSEELVAQARTHGVDAYLTKPYILGEFQTTVVNLLAACTL